MKNYLINYATPQFFTSQFRNATSGLVAGFSSVLQWKKEDIDQEFYKKNSSILDQQRGGGYWLWKPYFILKTLDMIEDGDAVFYSDSGAAFSKPVVPLLKALANDPRGVVGFKLAGPHKEGAWTRRNIFKDLDMDTEEIRYSQQHMASFFMVRKLPFGVEFVKEWLGLCQDPSLLTDDSSHEDAFPEFQEHRHDQSLLSLLIKKHNLTALPDPTQWGLYHQETTQADVYFDHHRNVKINQ